jgi:hypothetical protein
MASAGCGRRRPQVGGSPGVADRPVVPSIRRKPRRAGCDAGRALAQAHWIRPSLLALCNERGSATEIELIPAERITEAHARIMKSDVEYRFVIDKQALPAAR